MVLIGLARPVERILTAGGAAFAVLVAAKGADLLVSVAGRSQVR